MTTVKIGMDQWAVANLNAGTSLYTSGLSGCVAVALQSEKQIGLTHVASDAHLSTDDRNWQLYEQALDGMFNAMNGVSPVKTAHLVAAGKYDHPPFTNISKYLECKKISVLKPAAMMDNGLFVGADGKITRNADLDRKLCYYGYRRLFEQEAVAAVTKHGNLLQPQMPSPANDGVIQEGEVRD